MDTIKLFNNPKDIQKHNFNGKIYHLYAVDAFYLNIQSQYAINGLFLIKRGI